MKGQNFGLAGNLVVGIIAAILGGFLFWFVGLTTTGLLGSPVCAPGGNRACVSALSNWGQR